MTTTATATQPITWTRVLSDGSWVFKAQFMVDDIEIYLTGERWPLRRNRNTRVYVSGEPKVDFTEAEKLSRKAGSFNRGESVEADKAWDAANRALVQSKKDFLEALKATIPVLGEVLSDHKLNFNRKAGCSCGCSPGFVADRQIRFATSVPNWHEEYEEANLIMTDVSAYKRSPKAEEVKAS